MAKAGRSLAIAAVSTVVVFGLLAFVVVNSTGWPRFQQAFLNGPIFWESLPKLVEKFWVNVRLFLIAEGLILVFGMLLALLRSVPGPVFTPLRIMATVYVDVFRALPGRAGDPRARPGHPVAPHRGPAVRTSSSGRSSR